MQGIEPDDTPSLVDDVIESIDVAGVLHPIRAMVIAVVLGRDAVLGVREVGDRDEPAGRVDDRDVHLRFRQPGVDDVEPELGLRRGVRAGSDPPEGRNEPSLSASAGDTAHRELQLFGRGERRLPPKQRIPRHDQLALGERSGELAPGVDRMDHREPERLDDPHIAREDPVAVHPHRTRQPIGGERGDVHLSTQPTWQRKPVQFGGGAVAEDLGRTHPRRVCEAARQEGARLDLVQPYAVERAGQVGPPKAALSDSGGRGVAHMEWPGSQILRKSSSGRHPPTLLTRTPRKPATTRPVHDPRSPSPSRGPVARHPIPPVK